MNQDTTTEVVDSTDSEGSTSAAAQSLSDLTTKQQAIIVAHLEDPEASDAVIADRVGSSRSYPWHVYESAGPLIDDLKRELEAGRSIEEIVRQELSEEETEEIVREGLFDNLDVDLHAITGGDPGATRELGAVRDGPVNGPEARIMTAGPQIVSETTESFADDVGTDASDGADLAPVAEETAEEHGGGHSGGEHAGDPHGEAAAAAERAESVRAPAAGGRADDERDVSTGGVPASEITSLLDRIQFSQRLLARQASVAGSDSPPHVRSQLSILQEVEAELEALLQYAAGGGEDATEVRSHRRDR